jgi:hypothetical protein
MSHPEVKKKYPLDTQNIFREVKAQEPTIDRNLLLELRESMEDLLCRKGSVEVVFSPLEWRYHRQVFLKCQRSEFSRENPGKIFSDGTFVRPSSTNGICEMIEKLSEDEKIQIVAPLRSKSDRSAFMPNAQSLQKSYEEGYFEDLTPERKKEILAKLNEKAGLGFVEEDTDNDANPYDFYRWSYDIYDLGSSCELENPEKDEYPFFFAWWLRLSDIFDLKPFLQYQLDTSFDGKVEKFKEFIYLSMIKYERILKDSVSFDPQQRLTFINDTLAKMNLSSDEEKNKIKVSNPKIQRKAHDKATSLTLSQTAYLFKLLREQKVIFKDPSYQSAESIYKAIYLLTGYNTQNLKTEMNKKNVSEEDKVVMQKIIKSLSS